MDEHDSSPDALTALGRADHVGRDAARTGFDWPDALEALEKVREEVAELDDAIRTGVVADIREEFGDLLFAASSVARLLDIDAEAALHEATAKFENRFRLMRRLVNRDDRDLNAMTLDEMEEFWRRAKSLYPGEDTDHP